MKKISKKIVSLVTLAAFALTLVPAAAFAAPGGAVEPDNSYIYLSDKKNANVFTGEQVDYTLELKNADNEQAATSSNVYIWAEDEEGNVARSVKFYDKANEEGKEVAAENLKVIESGYALKPNLSQDGREMAIAFTKAGTYTIHAGYALDGNAEITNTDQLIPLNNVENQDTIVVDAADAVVNHVVLMGADKVGGGTENAVVHDGGSATYTLGDDFLVNGIDTKTIEVNAYNAENKALRGENFTLDTNKNGINLEETAVTTDGTGKFEIKFTMDKADNYKIYVTGDDLEFTINVNRADASELDTIENTTSDEKTLLASNDTKYPTQGATNFADAVQFTITKDNGEVATEDAAIANEPAADKDSVKDHSKYVSILGKPGKSKIEADDIELVWSAEKEAYTLQYVGNNAKADLIDGEYSVKVALTSGKSAVANFTLAKFGTVQDLALDLNNYTNGTSGDVVLGADLTDRVVLGTSVWGVVKYVDENGIEVTPKAGNIAVGVKGAAVNQDNINVKGAPEFNFGTLANTSENENLLGTIITVTAFDDKVGKMVETQLTVVDGQSVNTLAFDTQNGDANKNNTVEVSIVDEEGNLVKQNGSMYAYVADQSNEDAKIEVTPNEVQNGKGDLVIFSDKETTVDVVVGVKVGNALYANTLEYTVGAEDINADKSVVMTMGSTDYVVNNNIVTGDAAPYVDGNWRTMVPVRALAETFGAEVTFEDNVITIVDGDKTIVMTVGEDTYTVNDEEKTMDTVPVIGEGDRTFVPTRFVAEALGYTVTPLQDANGLTASVVFQK